MAVLGVKRLGFVFLNIYLMIIAFVIKLPHIAFITAFFWSIVIASISISYLCVRKIKIRTELPTRMNQGEEGVITHTIEKMWFLLPQLSAQVILPPPLVNIAPASLSLPEGRGEERFFATKRGVYIINEVMITCLDFLGIFRFRKKQRIEGELVIYPSYVKISPIFLYSGKGEEGLGGSQPARGGVEFAAVREWQQGESERDIHWKLTAKWRKFFVVLHTQAGSRSQIIVIDCSNRGVFGDLKNNTFELSLKVAASLAWATISNGGEVTLLYSIGGEEIVTSQHSSFISVLEELARMEPNSTIGLSSLLDRATIDWSSTLTILTSLPDHSVVPFLQKAVQMGVIPFILLMNGASFGKEGWFANSFLGAVNRLANVGIISKEDNLKERLERLWGMHYSI